MKEEAIVVTEPKERKVMEFNEEEIRGLAKEEAVKVASETPSGTKLYKHSIRTTDSQWQDYVIVCELQDILTIHGTYVCYGYAGKHGPGTNAITGPIYAFENTSGTASLTFMGLFSDGTIKTSLVSNITDTVTEL